MTKKKKVIVWTCAHADPGVDNERFTWLGQFIYDQKPDYCIDLGDGADMRSLNSYDTRYPQRIVHQNYEEDIESYNDSQERLRHPFKYNKKKRPLWIGFEGNHEHRIETAIEHDPRLKGTKHGLSFEHLQTDHWFDEYHRYSHSAPALCEYDGVVYGHYVSAGAYGRPLAGKHHGAALVDKLASSVTVGHSHKFSYFHKADARPVPLNGLVAGCFKGKDESWAGQSNQEWRRGVVVKNELENGNYDIQWVSLDALRREYSK